MIKYINFILFFVVVILVALCFRGDKITKDALDLFPDNDDRKIVDIYQKFASSQYVLVAIKGFSQDSKNTLEKFLHDIKGIDNIENATLEIKPNAKLQEFIENNYLAIATPNPQVTLLSKDSIKTKLLDTINYLKDAYGSEDPTPKDTTPSINPLDPLSLFSINASQPTKLIAKDYGYMALVEMKRIDKDSIESTLQEFKKISVKYPDIRYFSQSFMNVENLSLILQEVSYLTGFTTIFFILLYFAIIRIPMLTINTILTLVISNSVAMLIVIYVYPKTTIMALLFGTGVANIAIDYMMHHNFFGLYAKRGRFNKPVFYGYITTIIGFGACLFIPFPLLSQLSLYAIVSLSVNYISFAFIYPRIGFSNARLFSHLDKMQLRYIPSRVILITSLIMAIVAFYNARLDFDLSKIDYQNKSLLKEQEFFLKSYTNQSSNILLSGDSVDSLLSLADNVGEFLHNKGVDSSIALSILPTQARIKENVAFLQSSIVSKNISSMLSILPTLKIGMLKSAKNADLSSSDLSEDDVVELIDNLFSFLAHVYDVDKLTQRQPLSVADINSFGFNIVESTSLESSEKKKFYYIATLPSSALHFVKEYIELTHTKDIELRSLQSVIDSITNSIYIPMLCALGFAFCCMVVMLFFTTRGAFLDSIGFILFPISSALFVISMHADINIMHLFALLILVVVSIDYGIYIIKEGNNIRTIHAIFFSGVTTGISFGVFVISNTKALSSFGEVVFIGMFCVLFMLVFQRLSIDK